MPPVFSLRPLVPSAVNPLMSTPSVILKPQRAQPFFGRHPWVFAGAVEKVDGKPAELLAAYGVARGVVVPAGEHEVTFAYRPRSVQWGAAMSLAGLLLVAAVTYGSRRASRPGQA